MPRLRHSLAVLACALPLAACGGGDAPEKPAATPVPTAAGGGASAVTACIAESDAALGLEARESDNLQMDGVDASLYETIAVDQDGLGMQVLVYGSAEDAETSLGEIEANGFFDDVRPAGNAIVIRRGGDAPGTLRVVECAFQA